MQLNEYYHVFMTYCFLILKNIELTLYPPTKFIKPHIVKAVNFGSLYLTFAFASFKFINQWCFFLQMQGDKGNFLKTEVFHYHMMT